MALRVGRSAGVIRLVKQDIQVHKGEDQAIKAHPKPVPNHPGCTAMDPAKLVLIPLALINRNPINLAPINPTPTNLNLIHHVPTNRLRIQHAPTNLPLINLALIHPVLIKPRGEAIIGADHLRQNSLHPDLLNTHYPKVLPSAAKAVGNHFQELTDPQVAAHLLVLLLEKL